MSRSARTEAANENPYASPPALDPDDCEANPLGSKGRAWWTDNDRLDRVWLRANVAVWLVGLIYLISVMGPISAVESLALLIFAAEGSAAFTLFFVTIPSRVALNLLVRERRRRYFKETAVCCVTFCILCWVAYLFLRGPNPYP